MSISAKKKANSSEVFSAFEKDSLRRKAMAADGSIPEWYITQGLTMFERKYAFKHETVREAFTRVAKTLAKHYTPDPKRAEVEFFNLLWSGNLAGSSPVISNTGTGRGHSVSCSGGVIDDSVPDFYDSYKRIALLSQKGYGTSDYLGHIRPRGSIISTGGFADGPVPVLDTTIDTSKKINQGDNRRGQHASYFEASTPDFKEIYDYAFKNQSEVNIGWNFRDADIARLQAKDSDMISRWNDILYMRSRYGKGYIFKPDLANQLAPFAIKASGLQIWASNLCTEIMLPASRDYTFSCVLSSLNLMNFFNFGPDTIFWAHIFLDCVVSETLDQTRDDPNFASIYRFTEEFRALGLGTLGFHSLLQSRGIPMESLEARYLNKEIFQTIEREQMRANLHLGKVLGPCKWGRERGLRNSTNSAIAPNVSSSILCGGWSQGIEPLAANTYNQPTAAGEMTRMNPFLIKELKRLNLFNSDLMEEINVGNQGSIQFLEKFMDADKLLLFKTAYEMDQMALVRLAEDRQPHIDQGQSLNLFFGTDERKIAKVTKYALLSKRIKSLYYQRSMRQTRSSTGECVACEG